MTPAQHWGRELAKVMERMGISQVALARAIGFYQSTVSTWTRGRSLPQHATAVHIADVLMAPHLAELSARLHTRVCPVDSVSFIHGGKQRRATYCSRRCGNVAKNRSNRFGQEQAAVRLATLNTRRLRLYRETVDRFCRTCEPEGLCRTPTCPIKVADLSPLPLADERLRIA